MLRLPGIDKKNGCRCISVGVFLCQVCFLPYLCTHFQRHEGGRKKKRLRDMSMNTSRNDIAEGLRDGTPIALGYFAVAFSLGIIAKKAGLTAVLGFVSSFFTRASAGEYGVYTLVALNAPTRCSASPSGTADTRHRPTPTRRHCCRRSAGRRAVPLASWRAACCPRIG